jgi:hypothetical protein
MFQTTHGECSTLASFVLQMQLNASNGIQNCRWLLNVESCLLEIGKKSCF